MYVFDKPVPASDARKNHGFDTLVAVERELPMVVKAFKECAIPEKFFPDTVGQDIVVDNIKQSTAEVKVKFPEKATVDEVLFLKYDQSLLLISTLN